MKLFTKLRLFMGLPFSLSIFLVFSAPIVSAQTDMFIYPGKGQNQAQQDKDRYECHSWAVQQTGFDPSRPQSANPQPAQQRQQSPPPVLQGAARGAALGAVGGVITGNAGKGAAAGAAMGAWLAVSAVVTKGCDKQTLAAVTRRRRLIPGDRHICARCRRVCTGAAIPSIEVADRSEGGERSSRFVDETH